jgi:hypothetical protein
MTAIRDDDVLLSSARSARGSLQCECLRVLRQMWAAGEWPARPTSSRFIDALCWFSLLPVLGWVTWVIAFVLAFRDPQPVSAVALQS